MALSALDKGRCCTNTLSNETMRLLLKADGVRQLKLPLYRFKYQFVRSFTADKYYVFRTLGLESFSDLELRKSYGEVFTRESKGDLHSGLKALLLKKADAIDDDEEVDEKVRQIAEYLTTKERVKTYSYNPLKWISGGHQEVADDKTKDESKQQTTPVSSLNPTLSFEDFKSKVRISADKLDSKVPAVMASAVLTGTSIGVVIPCMPILVQTIGMPPSEFGLVIAAFGVSKMICNIPSAYFVETYGRKPVMVAGLALCGLGLAGVGLTLVDGFGTPWLIGCRLVSGLGVSAFTGGTFMLLSDISTSLNRTRTPASVMAGFQSGIAVGPALGGVMVNLMGVGPTYFFVGGLFGIMASLNHMFLTETMPGKTLYQKRMDEKKAEERMRLKNAELPLPLTGDASHTVSVPVAALKKKAAIVDVGIAGSFRVALLSWRELMKKKDLRDVMFIYGAYWAAIAGTQMTLLPLMMVGPGLHLGASEIGMTFAFISMTGVAASTPVAYLADRHGKLNCMIGGCALVATAMAVLPHADSFYYVLAASIPLSVGSTTMSACPVARVTDLVSTEDRSQAQALLRTSSDIGLLIGATVGGLYADAFSIESAFTGYSALMAVSTIWFANRTIGVQGIGSFLGWKTVEESSTATAAAGSKERPDVAVEYNMVSAPIDDSVKTIVVSKESSSIVIENTSSSSHSSSSNRDNSGINSREKGSSVGGRESWEQSISAAPKR